METKIDRLAFEGPNKPLHGYTMRVYYLIEPKGDALVELFKDGEPVRQFLFPAYKIYNLQSHFPEIVAGELANSDAGYRVAASTGFEGLAAK